MEELLCFQYMENTKAPINKRCYFCVLCSPIEGAKRVLDVSGGEVRMIETHLRSPLLFLITQFSLFLKSSQPKRSFLQLISSGWSIWRRIFQSLISHLDFKKVFKFVFFKKKDFFAFEKFLTFFLIIFDQKSEFL